MLPVSDPTNWHLERIRLSRGSSSGASPSRSSSAQWSIVSSRNRADRCRPQHQDFRFPPLARSCYRHASVCVHFQRHLVQLFRFNAQLIHLRVGHSDTLVALGRHYGMDGITEILRKGRAVSKALLGGPGYAEPYAARSSGCSPVRARGEIICKYRLGRLIPLRSIIVVPPSAFKN